jgi:hypothetical protein
MYSGTGVQDGYVSSDFGAEMAVTWTGLGCGFAELEGAAECPEGEGIWDYGKSSVKGWLTWFKPASRKTVRKEWVVI